MALPRALTAVAQPVARSALGRKRTVLGSLLMAWPDIVGAEMARRAVPDRVALSGAGRDDGVLVLRVASADALSLTYAIPGLRQQINTHYGYPAIAKIKLKHGTVGRPASGAQAVSGALMAQGRAAFLAAAASETVQAELAGVELASVEDPEIRQALERLGQALAIRESQGS